MRMICSPSSRAPLRISFEIPLTAGDFVLCPYSHRPFVWVGLTCGVRGILVRFAQGDCRDYKMWRAADLGMKNGQTLLTPDTMRRMMTLLALAANERAKTGWQEIRKGGHNIYVAKTE